jgi:hypothetical protein
MRIVFTISSPMKMNGKNGSGGTAEMKLECAKKKPAAMKAAYLGKLVLEVRDESSSSDWAKRTV